MHYIQLLYFLLKSFYSKYFWKNKKKKKEGDAENAPQKQQNGFVNSAQPSNNNQNHVKPPKLNLEQVNLAFDKAYDNGSFDHGPPTDSSIGWFYDYFRSIL